MISLSNGNQLTTSGPRSCRDSFSNVRFLRTVTVALFILLIGLTIAFIVTRGKNDSRQLKPNASNTSCLQGAEMCDPNTSPSNDPFCQFPFPCKNVSYMKCFLPYKGKYTVHCVFDLHGQVEVTRICSINDTYYHYKLDCASSFGNNCNQVCSGNCTLVCKDDCTQFSVTIPKSDILLLEIGDNCLHNDGYIEIWNATIHRKRKRESQSQSQRNKEQ